VKTCRACGAEVQLLHNGRCRACTPDDADTLAFDAINAVACHAHAVGDPLADQIDIAAGLAWRGQRGTA